MSDWNSLIERINRHEKAYKETGLIGVYDHVLLKELIEARDEIEQLQKIRDIAQAIYGRSTVTEGGYVQMTKDEYLSLGPLLFQPVTTKRSEFSEFIRNASPEEKEKVYSEVMDAAVAAQENLMQPSPLKTVDSFTSDSTVAKEKQE